MKPWVRLCAQGGGYLLSCLASFALWSLWLALALFLVVQIHIATSSRLDIPQSLLRRGEAILAESGVHASFGGATFDPMGRILLEDVRLSLPAFPEPVLTTRSVFVRLNLRALLLGLVEPASIEIDDATIFAPAQLTPSGRSEPLLRGLHVTLEPDGRELRIREAGTRCANLTISAHGAIPLPRRSGGPSSLRMLLETPARRFPDLCRTLLSAAPYLEMLEDPTLHLEITPAPDGSASLSLAALARKASIPQPVAADIDRPRATATLHLAGQPLLAPIPILLSAAGARLADGSSALGLTARFPLIPSRPAAPEDIRLTIDSLSVAGASARAISAHLTGAWPNVSGTIATRIFEAPLSLQAEADLASRAAHLRFEGSISPRVLDIVSQRVGVDVRRYYDFDSLEAEAGEATFADGWKFQRLAARVHIPRMNSYGVIMEDGHASVVLEPGRFHSPEAFARVGENFARGSYDHDLRTHSYRFLLEGRLRPLAISPWFREWWPDFFRQFEFPDAPPEASVDVAGIWKERFATRLFLFAETPKAVLRGTELERLRSLFFIRPGFVDALELVAHSGEGAAQSAFTYRADPESGVWRSLDFTLESKLHLPLAARLLGPANASTLSAFQTSQPPEVKAHGRFFGPASDENTPNLLEINARAPGEFRFHDFPLRDVAFSATMRGSDVVVDHFQGTFAGGSASGRARVWGEEQARRVGFDISLQGAPLGQAATTLQTFLAGRRSAPPPEPGRFVKTRANVNLDIAASAEGSYNDPFSFHGNGNVLLKGGDIGEVPLLGLLSDILPFTSLRFTEARGNFKIEGPKLVFPKVELRGANSAIDAHGNFALDRSTLDFNARVFPFQESNNLIKSVVGAVLTPLSNALEVRLTGTLEDPNWAFLVGPTNVLRSLTESAQQPPASPESPSPPKP